jgi:hypothetical protein
MEFLDFIGPVDLLVILLLMGLVPLLVNHYLSGPSFTPKFRQQVICGGIIWIVYSLFGEGFVYDMLGISPMDAYVHWTHADKAAAELARGRWPFTSTIPQANEAYVAYLALLTYLLGISYHLAVTINGWLGFWGGLVLAKCIGGLFPHGKDHSPWLFLVIFFPSTIFWTTGNLKEAFMYWSGCQIFAVTFVRSGGLFSLITPGAVAGILVGGLFRPHVCAVWLASCAGVTLLRRGQRLYALLMLLALPIVMTGLQSVTGVDVSSPTAALEHWSKRGVTLVAPTQQSSNIEFGPEGPIFFVSGFTSVFFRPFPWQVGSVRVFITGMETWTLTLILILGWWKMTSVERSILVRLPPIQAAALVCFMFSIFFTYLPNEGIMVRQRVQMVPALLVLAFVPYFLRDYMKQRLAVRNFMNRSSYRMRDMAAR